MSENEILSLSKEELSRMFASGEARLTPLTEARIKLGKDFLAGATYKELEDKLKRAGIDAEFIFDDDSFPYVGRDIELACIQGEMLIHRPKAMKVTSQSGDIEDLPITLANLQKIFKKGNIPTFEDEFVLSWDEEEDFVYKDALIGGWTLVKKEPLTDSTNKNWTEQEVLLKNYAQELEDDGAAEYMVRRRTAVEAAFDTMLFYSINGEKLLPLRSDLTSSLSSRGDPVRVGFFHTGRLRIGDAVANYPWPDFGVVPQR